MYFVIKFIIYFLGRKIKLIIFTCFIQLFFLFWLYYSAVLILCINATLIDNNTELSGGVVELIE
jgi:hypothetical protein